MIVDKSHNALASITYCNTMSRIVTVFTRFWFVSGSWDANNANTAMMSWHADRSRKKALFALTSYGLHRSTTRKWMDRRITKKMAKPVHRARAIPRPSTNAHREAMNNSKRRNPLNR